MKGRIAMKDIKKHLGKLKGVSGLPEVKISLGNKFKSEPIGPSKRQNAYK